MKPQQHGDVEQVLRAASPQLELKQRPQVHDPHPSTSAQGHLDGALPGDGYEGRKDVEGDPIQFTADDPGRIALANVSPLQPAPQTGVAQQRLHLRGCAGGCEVHVVGGANVPVSPDRQAPDQDSFVPEDCREAGCDAVQSALGAPHRRRPPAWTPLFNVSTKRLTSAARRMPSAIPPASRRGGALTPRIRSAIDLRRASAAFTPGTVSS